MPRQLKILVADDREDDVTMLGMLLETEGHEVVSVVDGGRVLDEVVRERPQVALLDINMGKHSGYDIARNIRERLGGDITLVAVSGYKQQTDHMLAMIAGFNHYLTKPYSAETLIELINRIAEHTRRG
ncbi:MAG: response regulator [Betaproteobacteria bacterium]